MATSALIRTALPSVPELESFARTAAHLLNDQHSRTLGSRIIRRTAGVGMQHLDHRDYVAGDEVRHIDWRQTARRRRPILRRFESESSSDWTIVLDASSSMLIDGGAKWQAALSAAAAMSYALLELGHRVGLLAFGNGLIAESPRGRGRHHYSALVHALSELRPPRAHERSELGACARRLHDGACVFVISDFLAADEMRRDLSAVLERCASLHALQVSDSTEVNLPVSGDIDLVDVETGARMTVRHDAHATDLAAAERAAMTRRLRNFCIRSGIVYTDWELAQPWQRTLVQHLVLARSIC